jgi:hypothetical protein
MSSSEPPRGERLSIDHRPVVESLLSNLHAPLSEYLFANLFLFREVHDYRLKWEPCPHILGLTYDGARHAMPLIVPGVADIERLLDCAACVYPLPQQVLAGLCAQRLYVHWNDADADYVYDARQLAQLHGPLLKAKKRQASHFEAASQPAVSRLDAHSLRGAYELLDLWADQVAPLNRQTDYSACREALGYLEKLGLFGISVSTSSGRTCAFLVASRLGADTAVVHFAKADRTLEGVYPYLFSRFAQGADYSWLNFEQDLGKAGLRQAKRALSPAYTLRKCRLSRIE